MEIAVFAGMDRSRASLLVSAALAQAMSAAPARAEEVSVPTTYTPIVRAHPEGGSQTQPAPSPAAQAPTQAQPPATARHWYGSQVLLVDGVSSLPGIVVAKASNGDTGLKVMAAGWVLGAPAVHLVHHRPWTALGSLAMRASFTLVPYYVGGPCKATCTAAGRPCANGPNASEEWQLRGETCNGALGFLVGSVVAIAIDSALLSWEDVPAAAVSQATTPARHGIGIDGAGVFPLDAGAGLSLGGRF